MRPRQREHAARFCQELIVHRKVRIILQIKRLARRAAAAHAAEREDARAEAQLRGDCCTLAGQRQLIAAFCHQRECLARERASGTGRKRYPQHGVLIGLEASPAHTVQSRSCEATPSTRCSTQYGTSADVLLILCCMIPVLPQLSVAIKHYACRKQ